MKTRFFLLVLAVSTCAEGISGEPNETITSGAKLDWICISKDGSHFAYSQSGKRFLAWGFNYDRDYNFRLLEEYWDSEWSTVATHFKEMKALGANVVRIHLSVARFVKSPRETDAAALEKLARLLNLAEESGLYLDITGLGCYRKTDVPEWYNAMSEAERWGVQALFWSGVAKTCAQSPAVFCYDLMNEPVLPASGRKETEWMAGELSGLSYTQRLTLDLAGRTQEQVIKGWVEKLVH